MCGRAVVDGPAISAQTVNRVVISARYSAAVIR